MDSRGAWGMFKQREVEWVTESLRRMVLDAMLQA